MGYLSQKKKFERMNLALNASLIIVGAVSVLAFFSVGHPFFASLSNWRLQLYAVAVLIFIAALFHKFFIQSFLAFLLILVNYFVIGSSANIINNIEGNGRKTVSVVYQNATREIVPLVKTAEKAGADLIGVNHKHQILLPESLSKYRIFHDEANLGRSFILTDLPPLRAGKLRFSQSRSASFINVSKDGHRFVFVNIDFSDLKPSEEENVYHNLAEFILSQDEPVVIVGDFGIPAWTHTFQDFLVKTGLEVKNRVIMSGGSWLFNPFAVPTFNVLAYQNFGIRKLEFLDKGKNPHYPLLIELGI